MKPLFLILILLPWCFLHSQTILWSFDTHDSSFGNTAAGDIDGDGKLEIVFGCYRNDSSVYALNGEDGSLLWKRNLSGAAEGCNDVAPLIYDVDEDGELEVIVPASCNPRTFCMKGADGLTEWETVLHGSDSPPTVSDIDNDGKPEILHGNFGGWVSCLNGENGSIAWDIQADTNGWIQTAPTILDANNDGQLDFVIANWSFGDDHRIMCISGDNQQILWENDTLQDVVYHGASVADIDMDGYKELVIGSYDGHVYCFNAEDGSVAWRFSFPDSFYIGAPTSIADLNDDGLYEIIFFDYNRVGCLSNTGNLLWDFTILNLGQSFRGAAISDIDGNDKLDVVFGTSSGVLFGLSGDDGSTILNLDLAAEYGSPDFEIDHGPVIADFNQDGFIDIFVVGGHTEFPNFQNNFGRGYLITLNATGGPDWLMFRKDSVRSGLLPITIPSSIEEKPVKENTISWMQDASTLRLSGLQGAVLIEMFDLRGRRVIRERKDFNSSEQLDISRLPSAMYVLRVSANEWQQNIRVNVVHN